MDDILISEEDASRFWSKVDKHGDDECWPWLGWKGDFGHGRFDLRGRKVLAHQVALILDGQPRPPPPSDNALHGDCSNPSCVNPAHLRWGTKLENTEDRDRLGRRVKLPRGEANGNSKITEDIVRVILASDEPQRALARRFGISQAWVSKIKRREVWSHLA